jgi:hypothetical protein
LLVDREYGRERGDLESHKCCAITISKLVRRVVSRKVMRADEGYLQLKNED